MSDLVSLGVQGVCRGSYRIVSNAGAANGDPTIVADHGADLHQIVGHNAAGAARYLKLYDKSTAPASTDTPKATFYLPASSPFNIPLPPLGFLQGLGLRIVTGSADNDNTAATAADILGLNLFGAGF